MLNRWNFLKTGFYEGISLGLVYAYQGRYGDAESMHFRALEVVEAARGRDHEDILDTLYGLAQVYRLQSRYDEAGVVYGRARAIVERAHGPESTAMAHFLERLSELYFETSRQEESGQLIEQALRIRAAAE